MIIDHLGILKVPDDAPMDIKSSDTMAPGFIMQQLFEVCKAANVFMIILQQLPKEVAPGVPFSYDAGRGGSKQTDYCDYIFQIWRPEQAAELEDAERASLEGEYKLAFGKNRFGASTLSHLYFDKATLRIMPALRVTQPTDMADLSENEKIFMAENGTEKAGDFGGTEAGMHLLVENSPDPIPRDTDALMASIGALEEEDGSHEDDPFADVPE